MARRRWLASILAFVLLSPSVVSASGPGEISRASQSGLFAHLEEEFRRLVAVVANLGPILDPAGTSRGNPHAAPTPPPPTDLSPGLAPAG